MSEHEKIAIITGAGTGIGNRTALALLEEGYSVTIAGRGGWGSWRQPQQKLARKPRGCWWCRPTWATPAPCKVCLL